MAVSLIVAEMLLIAISAISIIFGIINVIAVNSVDMEEIVKASGTEFEENEGLLEDNDDDAEDKIDPRRRETVDQAKYELMLRLHSKIADGANSFLYREYAYMFVFMIFFSIVIGLLAETNLGEVWTVIAFVLGAIISIVSGFLGMRIAVAANVRTTKECSISLSRGFVVAYKAGSVLGFTLVGLALLFLTLLVMVYRRIYLQDRENTDDIEEYQRMFEKVAGYGLGGSCIALFGRVGGGIYTKAADVGADLAGKVVKGLPEDDIRNPGTIADNVGDNVGDIAGMGSDLFGSLAESSCAALVVSGTSPELVLNTGAFYFPLLLTAAGIIASLITWMFATNQEACCKIQRFSDVEKVIKYQLIISTGILIPFLFIVSFFCLPDKITFAAMDHSVSNIEIFVCAFCGLISGFCIGIITEYYTSNEYYPVQELADSCKKGAAPNIIKGLALGYMSTVVPIFCLAITIYIAFSFADMYGIAVAALGMLSNLCIALAIDGYGPISDNAGGIAEMCHLSLTRIRTDRLDAAGNTTAAIGKGFAIGSACLVSLALFGAFATRTHLTSVNVLEPLQFAGLIVGAMLPYAFSAMTMKAVGTAAEAMIDEIARQDREGLIREGVEPDYAACIAISTNSSLREMIAPGCLVIFSPIITGLFFGPRGVAGLLAGAIVSAIQMAISASNTGGAWDNAKKYIEANKLQPDILNERDDEGNTIILRHNKGTDTHKAAVVGDTVGDPLKDTSGPALNILIKLMAIVSLVFGDFYERTAWLIK
jgi:H(+)-translocating pyrophosphatase